jgi:hypothetical protein
MFRDHIQFGNGEAVITRAGTHRSIYLVPNEFYLMAQMCLQINTAGGDLENQTSPVFRNCVVAIRSTQAAFNGSRVRIAACGGSLRKTQRHQHGRYSHQQECSSHGILLRFSLQILASRRSEVSLGI